MSLLNGLDSSIDIDMKKDKHSYQLSISSTVTADAIIAAQLIDIINCMINTLLFI
jgi:hypothetical protein